MCPKRDSITDSHSTTTNMAFSTFGTMIVLYRGIPVPDVNSLDRIFVKNLGLANIKSMIARQCQQQNFCVVDLDKYLCSGLHSDQYINCKTCDMLHQCGEPTPFLGMLINYDVLRENRDEMFTRFHQRGVIPYVCTNGWNCSVSDCGCVHVVGNDCDKPDWENHSVVENDKPDTFYAFAPSWMLHRENDNRGFLLAFLPQDSDGADSGVRLCRQGNMCPDLVNNQCNHVHLSPCMYRHTVDHHISMSYDVLRRTAIWENIAKCTELALVAIATKIRQICHENQSVSDTTCSPLDAYRHPNLRDCVNVDTTFTLRGKELHVEFNGRTITPRSCNFRYIQLVIAVSTPPGVVLRVKDPRVNTKPPKKRVQLGRRNRSDDMDDDMDDDTDDINTYDDFMNPVRWLPPQFIDEDLSLQDERRDKCIGGIIQSRMQYVFNKQDSILPAPELWQSFDLDDSQKHRQSGEFGNVSTHIIHRHEGYDSYGFKIPKECVHNNPENDDWPEDCTFDSKCTCNKCTSGNKCVCNMCTSDTDVRIPSCCVEIAWVLPSYFSCQKTI
jgi:hypothetical protein